MKPEIQDWNSYIIQMKMAQEKPEDYFAQIADSYLWKKKWNKVMEGDFYNGSIKWFDGGVLNITENCLDRNVAAHPQKLALIWEPNSTNQEAKYFTYDSLLRKVCKAANGLRKLGIKKGDRVCIYLPMIPEAAIAMLACARIGAIHSVVFAGFSADSLADRIQDAQCCCIITADGFQRGEKFISLFNISEEALRSVTSVKFRIVLNHSGVFQKIPDGWIDWFTLMNNQPDYCEAEAMNAEDPFFILYTSGSTGKPKGVLHTCGGFMVYAGYTHRNVFQIQEQDIFWCTADLGWITGHSYTLYGPLLNGITTLIYEGIPTYPHPGRMWEIIDKHQVNIFYTAPTLIRALQMLGDEIPNSYTLSSLRVLGTVGEPINSEAWHWYFKYVGKEKCPIVDTWWQTETGGIMISSLAGITPYKPAWATLPLPGIKVVLLNDNGQEIPQSEAHSQGYLCIKKPWPGIMRSVYGHHQKFIDTYLKRFPGYYFTGDGALRDEKGNFRITGRVDDVINVSGHRIGTGELEDTINLHPDIKESAVVSAPHPIKGESIQAFVVVQKSDLNLETLEREVKETIAQHVGRFAIPDKIIPVSGLPKTRSGKIMRRFLRKIVHGEQDLGDTTSLLDPTIIDEIRGAVQRIQSIG